MGRADLADQLLGYGLDTTYLSIRHMISHTMEMMLAAMSVIWGGVVDRHRRLRIAFLESGGGWIAPWLDRMDRHFDDRGCNDTAHELRPSELLRPKCCIHVDAIVHRLPRV